MSYRAKSKINKAKKKYPELSEQEIGELVVEDMFGSEGVKTYKAVLDNPELLNDEESCALYAEAYQQVNPNTRTKKHKNKKK